MKIYDCITFSNERLLYNLRLNILDKFVDKFIVIEANYTHSGNPKKINFNINHYPKFKKVRSTRICRRPPLFGPINKQGHLRGQCGNPRPHHLSEIYSERTYSCLERYYS